MVLDLLSYTNFSPLFPKTASEVAPKKGHTYIFFWSCKALRDIWQKVASKVTEITGVLTTLTHQMCLFFAEIPGSSHPDQKLAHSLFSAVHWTIALFWRKPGVPWNQVLKRMAAIQLMEKISHTIMDTMPVYELKWRSWSP